jgi:hypothetical protein
MGDLEKWWLALGDKQRIELLKLHTGDVVPASMAVPVANAAQAVKAKWEAQPGYTFTVPSQLGEFLDEKRATSLHVR